MKTNKSNLATLETLNSGCEYRLVVIAKAGSESAYGIAAQDVREDNVCIKEIGTNKELALSIIDILNNYKVPHVHFLDIIDDLMNE